MERRRRGEIPDYLLLLEHPPVFTFGKRDSSADLLASRELIQKMGIELHKTDRGGRITYHGPGQLIGYVIFSLHDTVPDFVWKLEETIIRLLEKFHLEAERDEDHPGVWIDNRKIGALGLHVVKGVTSHGFAININCDLKPFRYIHPCGIPDREVTSLERELGWGPSMRDVKQKLLEEFSAVFRTRVSLAGNAPNQPE